MKKRIAQEEGMMHKESPPEEVTLASARGAVERRAQKLAKALWAKDPRTYRFMVAHALRSDSLPAQILANAMKTTASTSKRSAKAEKTAGGMYGLPAKTSALALQAITNLSVFVGAQSFTMKAANLRMASKVASDPVARFLLASMPPKKNASGARVVVSHSGKTAFLVEGALVELDGAP